MNLTALKKFKVLLVIQKLFVSIRDDDFAYSDTIDSVRKSAQKALAVQGAPRALQTVG